MAKCKYCHESISRLDKEVCPFCGGLKPLEGTDTTTQDITKVIGQVESKVQIKHKKRIVASLLALVFGILGLHEFYLGKKLRGLVTFLISTALIAGIGSAFYFTFITTAFGYLIPYFVVEAFMLIKAANYMFGHDVTDIHGDFLE